MNRQEIVDLVKEYLNRPNLPTTAVAAMLVMRRVPGSPAAVRASTLRRGRA